MNISEVKQAVDGLGTSFEEFKAANDQRLKEIEDKGAPSPEIVQKLDRIEEDIQKYSDLKERLETLELAKDTPARPGETTKEQQDHLKAFERVLRTRGKDHESVAQLQAIERDLQKKDVLIGTDTAGGHAVPEIIASRIEKMVLEMSPVRRRARVVTVGTSDYKELVDVRGESSGWVGEEDSRTKTNTPQLEEAAPTFGMLYAYPQVSEEALQDIFFDVGSWLTTNIAENFSQKEGEAFITGNGTKKPTGFLNGTPNAVDDDSRDYGTLQYFFTGVADDFAADPDAGDVFLDVVYGMKSQYRMNGIWAMNKTTMGKVRKFKDSDDRYLWQPGLAVGQPNTLIGYPVDEWDAMPDTGANAFPVAFGDFSRGYLIADRMGMRMTVDDNITTPGFVKWYVRKRVGGIILNSEAIKLIKCDEDATT